MTTLTSHNKPLRIYTKVSNSRPAVHLLFQSYKRPFFHVEISKHFQAGDSMANVHNNIEVKDVPYYLTHFVIHFFY